MAQSSAQGEVLLASGTFNVASAVNSKTVSVSYSGTPKKVLVTKDEITSGVGQMLAWFLLSNVDQTEINTAFPYSVNICHYVTSTGGNGGGYGQNSWTAAIISASSSAITIKQFSNNYKIQPGDYHWYIWGEQ